MGGKREWQKTKFDWDDVSSEEGGDLTQKKPSESAADGSSSDDDEANEDYSLKIVEEALLRRAARLASDDDNDNNDVVSGEPMPSSSSSQEAEVAAAAAAADLEIEMVKSKKDKKKKKKVKKMKIEDQAATVVANEEEKLEAANAVIGLAEEKKVNGVEITDNIVLRKLLRGPRYFDPPNSSWGTCFNCGEEGHAAVNCTVARRKKPCFVCGSLEHNAKQCRKEQDCFICKKGGHHAKDCPDKHKGSSLKSQQICLKCGDSGHYMFSCRNDYSTDDLKEIQCYVCKRFGHLCCVKYVDTSPREVSCYKCGLLGHSGMACFSLRGGESTDFGSRLCYKCGEGGHIARECTSSAHGHKRFGESKYSSPVLRSHKEKRDYGGFKSAPYDLHKARKRKHTQYEERGGPTTPQKAKHRGGWIMDDPGDFSPRKGKKNSWKSPTTASSWGHSNSNWNAGGGHASSSRSAKRTWNVSGSPVSQGSSKSFQQRYSASRFSYPSTDGVGRHHDWR